jgi:hypothetical protein
MSAGSLGSWPGRIETSGMVRRRLLLVAVIMALAVGGVVAVAGSGSGEPFSPSQLRDLSGLPEPPAHFVSTEDGDLRRLSPEEIEQLREIRSLIERFPVPDAFARLDGADRGEGKP